MSIDFTVAIPTYNGAERLPLVLEKLRSQVNTNSMSWEILIVDNNSNDNTAQVIQDYQKTWSYPFPLRYCFAEKQGLAFARQRAIEEAKGEFVGFLDDDNLPASDWVNAACLFGSAHPRAGAYGGKIRGVFEVEPAKALKQILFYLALVERGDRPLPYQPTKNGVPPGAGLVVRRDVWIKTVPTHLFLIGRVGKSMLPGEDAEALLHMHQQGWQIWYNPEMVVEHLISAKRLEKTYLLPFMRGIGLCRHRLRMLSLKQWQRPLKFPLYLISDLRHAILHFLRHRTALQTDLVAACEMGRLLGTLISPFYLWTLPLRIK